MKILITGGLGYIGGRLALHLAEKFSKQNIRILAKDDPKDVPRWAEGYEVVLGSVLDKKCLINACKGINAVVHLAALNEIDSGKYPNMALRVNGEGTLNALNAAVENNVKRFIYFSTFHVYGLNADGVISEDTLPAPVHPYSITHRVAEDFVRMMVNSNKLLGITLRLSNGFGCPSHPSINRWSLVFNDFCLQAVLSNKIVLKTSGKQYRDFITLTDICRCVEHVLKIDEQRIRQNGFTYNVGGECSLSILQVAELVAKRCQEVIGTSPEVLPGKDKTLVSGIPVAYNVDRLKRLGFKLTSNMMEEVDETIRFCARNREKLKCHLL